MKPIALKSIICLDLMKVEQSQVTGVVTNWKMRYCFKFSFEVPQNGRKKIPCKLLISGHIDLAKQEKQFQ